MAIRSADAEIAALDAVRERMWARRNRLINDLTELEAELDRLKAWEGDPAVLARRSVGGYGPTPYHDAQHPCGHVWKRDQFDEMLLGEAEAAGYAPCGFCGTQVACRHADAA